MPVSHAVKLRLISAFQKQKASETITAQVSRAEEEHNKSDQKDEDFQNEIKQCENRDKTDRSQDTGDVTGGVVVGGTKHDAISSEQNTEILRVAEGKAFAKRESSLTVIQEKQEQKFNVTVGDESVPQAGVNPSASTDLSNKRKKERIPQPNKRTKKRDKEAAVEDTQRKKLNRPKQTRGIPVDMIRSGDKEYKHLGQIDVRSITCYSELWSSIVRVGANINRVHSRLIYQDADSDWLALQADSPFAAFVNGGARRLVLVIDKTS